MSSLIHQGLPTPGQCSEAHLDALIAEKNAELMDDMAEWAVQNAEFIRCPNACTEPCAFPSCRCHSKESCHA